MAHAMARFRRHRSIPSRRSQGAVLIILPVIAMAALQGVARAADAPHEEQFVAAGSVNHAIVIREHAGWNSNCDAIAHPALYLDEPPRHGSVCARVEDINISSIYAGTESQCIGRRVRGVRLVYRPDAGFVGGDGLRYAVQYPSRRRSVAVNVTVADKVPAAAVPSSMAAPPAFARQMSGPVPTCTELMF